MGPCPIVLPSLTALLGSEFRNNPTTKKTVIPNTLLTCINNYPREAKATKRTETADEHKAAEPQLLNQYAKDFYNGWKNERREQWRVPIYEQLSAFAKDEAVEDKFSA